MRKHAPVGQEPTTVSANLSDELVVGRSQGWKYLGITLSVLSPLLAGAFGLVGAEIGANSAVRGIEMQIEADAAQTHLAFLKDKRINVYTSWLNAINELAAKEQAALDAADAFLVDQDSEAMRAALQEASAHLLGMESLEVQLSIVGSVEVSTAAAEMLMRHRALIDKMEALRNDPSLAPRPEEIPTSRELERTLSELAGRDDLAAASSRVRKQLEGLTGSASEATEFADALGENDVDFSRFLESVRSAKEANSRSRLLAVILYHRIETEYDAFISAAREDLAIEAFHPSPGLPRD